VNNSFIFKWQPYSLVFYYFIYGNIAMYFFTFRPRRYRTATPERPSARPGGLGALVRLFDAILERHQRRTQSPGKLR